MTQENSGFLAKTKWLRHTSRELQDRPSSPKWRSHSLIKHVQMPQHSTNNSQLFLGIPSPLLCNLVLQSWWTIGHAWLCLCCCCDCNAPSLPFPSLPVILVSTSFWEAFPDSSRNSIPIALSTLTLPQEDQELYYSLFPSACACPRIKTTAQ